MPTHPRIPTATTTTSAKQARACHPIQSRTKGHQHQHQCASGSQEDEQPEYCSSGSKEIFTVAGGVTRREFFATLGSAGAAAAAWAAVASSATAATGGAGDRKAPGGESKAGVFGTVREREGRQQ